MENGTDLTLADRKNLIFDSKGNVLMCQAGCTFQSKNCLENKKAKCECAVQAKETIIDLTKINFDKSQIVKNFFSTLKNSNFLVLKCYKLIFSKKGQLKNIGSYMMSGITFIFIVLMLIFIINDNKKINSFIKLILNIKMNFKLGPSNKSLKNEELKKNINSVKTYPKNKKNQQKNQKSKKQQKNFKKIKQLNKKRTIKNKSKSSTTGKKKNYPPKRKSIRKSFNEMMDFTSKTKEKLKSQNNMFEIGYKNDGLKNKKTIKIIIIIKSKKKFNQHNQRKIIKI